MLSQKFFFVVCLKEKQIKCEKEFDLIGNWIGSKGATMISEGMKNNSSLSILDLNGIFLRERKHFFK